MNDDEFRVSWRREGKPRRRRIYQTETAASALHGFLERHPEGMSESPDEPPGPYNGMAPIIEGPQLERRGVGEWEIAR